MKLRSKKNHVINRILKGQTSCTYCQLSFKRSSDVTIDHVLPKKHGGKNDDDNIVLCCSNCNEQKGKMLLSDFIQIYDIKITKLIDSFL
jgi:5-methylcytosine-specific restriction endonuclease McrA